jgi:hypothetical protein
VAVNGWQATWTYPAGQRVNAMWNGNFQQMGKNITVTPADYNYSIQAGESLLIGYLGSWWGRNSPPTGFALNGRRCDLSTAGE